MARQVREITIERGRSFRVVVDDAMHDPYAQSLLHQMYWLRNEWNMLARFLPVRGGRFLDLGAHLGSFSLTAAAHQVEVLAVEASATNAAMMRESVQLNQFRNMSIVHAAVYKEPCTLRFFDNGPFGFLVPQSDARFPEVPALPVHEILDRHGWDRVDLIKMDIEGAECWAVQSMEQLLARDDAPAIYYECNGRTLHDFGKSGCHQLRQMLEAHGYANFIKPYVYGPLRPAGADELQPDVVVDCLAVKPARFPVQPASAMTRWLRNPRRRLRGLKPIAGWLNGWPVGFPATEAEQIEDFRKAIATAIETAKTAHEPQIAHQQLERELARAPQWLLNDPVIRDYHFQQQRAVEPLAA